MVHLKLLFWNVGAGDCLPCLRLLISSHAPDIVVLAESPQPEPAVLSVLNEEGVANYNLTTNRSDRLQFFTAFSPTRFEPMHDGPGIAVRRIATVVADPVLLVAVHLPSKLHLEADAQAQLATRIGATVRDIEGRAGHKRTIVIGDLNMNPFELGVASSESFHAVSTRSVASAGGRTVMAEHREFFYNPMWSLLGDESPGPPGTYYYRDSGPLAYFWHTYDQVLLRPALADNFQPGDVTVLASAGDTSLLSARGVPDAHVADHLPILATIRLQEATNVSDKFMGNAS